MCQIELHPSWQAALLGIEPGQHLEIFYWLHLSRRDLLVQSPRNGPHRGTFALRSPLRPNPIGTSIVIVDQIIGPCLHVQGLDCLDQTPLIDIKPERARTPHGNQQRSDPP